MLTSYELERYAKKVATEYLNDNISLNDSIYKVAQERDLNYEQIARIAEEANTQVYLDLFNRAKPEDRYIEFPTASVSKIASKLRNTINETSKISAFKKFNDYFLPPGKNYIPAPHQAKEEAEKLATIKEADRENEPPEKGKYADKFDELHKKILYDQYKNAQLELKLYIEKQAEYVSQIARQEILSGNSVLEEFDITFKTALEKHGAIYEYLLKSIPQDNRIMDAKLGKAGSVKKAVDFKGIVNKDHWYYKELEKLSELLDDYQETKSDITKSREKIAKWKFWAGLGLATAVGLPAAVGIRHAFKTREEMKKSPLTLRNYPINKVR